MSENLGINDLKVNRWTGTDPEDGLPGQIKFWRDQFTRTKFPDKLAEFNEYVRREGLEEKTEYRTLDTTDKGEIRAGDRATISWDNHPKMGRVTGVAYNDSGAGSYLMVANYFIHPDYITIHKIERPVNALPTKPGLYTTAPNDRLESYRVFSLNRDGQWREDRKILNDDHFLFEYVADGSWILRRLVVEEAE